MPPERRVFASPPRSPDLAPISLLSSSSTTAPTAQDTLAIPTSLHIPNSSYDTSSSTSWTSGSKVQMQRRRAAAKRQNCSQTHEAQPRHQHLTRKQHRRLQDAHEEYHRQRELFQAQQQQQQRQQTSIERAQYQEEQQQYMYSPQPQSSGSSSSSSSSGQYPPYAAPFAPSQRFSSLSRSSSSSSINHSSLLDPTADATEATTKPRSRRSSPGLSDHHHHPPRQRGPYSAWTAIREKERHRLLTNLSTLRESLPTVPLPSQVARENLGRLHQRIQHRRARTRETILYDLHQGVKVVEAQVHRQVEMVLSRLKEAPASKYAFALTNNFLSQVIPPTSVTGSLLAQAANGLFYQAESSSSSPSIYAQQQQQQQQQEANGSRSEAETLTNDFDSIALAGQLGTDRPSALAGLGDPNGLSTKFPPGVAAACTQMLSAALPSFIPSMVAPLVCVFSYQTPAISDLVPIPYTPYPWSSTSSSSSSSTAAGASSSSNTKVEEPARKEFVYPWGHPDEPYPPPPASQPTPPSLPTITPATQSPPSSPSSPTNDKSRKQQQQPSTTGTSHPDSGIVIVHSKTWTQHEREALYLAATRFRLSGQWSKIREVMNLHRTNAEIESEYKKLYAHRDPSDDPLLDDDDDDIESHYDARPSIIDAMSHNQQSNVNSEEEDDADDETETMIFMKFGGARSANHKRQQLQHLQSRRLHYDQLHFQPPVPQQELQPHHHQQRQIHQQNYHHQQQQQYQVNGAFNVPPLHDTNTPYQQQQQQQRLSNDPDPIRIFKKEVMIDKRFTLEEIPMRI